MQLAISKLFPFDPKSDEIILYTAGGFCSLLIILNVIYKSYKVFRKCRKVKVPYKKLEEVLTVKTPPVKPPPDVSDDAGHEIVAM